MDDVDDDDARVDLVVDDRPYAIPRRVVDFLPHLSDCVRVYGGRVYIPIMSSWTLLAFSFIVEQLVRTRCSLDARDYVLPQNDEARRVVLEILCIYGAPYQLVAALYAAGRPAQQRPAPAAITA